MYLLYPIVIALASKINAYSVKKRIKSFVLESIILLRKKIKQFIQMIDNNHDNPKYLQKVNRI